MAGILFTKSIHQDGKKTNVAQTPEEIISSIVADIRKNPQPLNATLFTSALRITGQELEKFSDGADLDSEQISRQLERISPSLTFDGDESAKRGALTALAAIEDGKVTAEERLGIFTSLGGGVKGDVSGNLLQHSAKQLEKLGVTDPKAIEGLARSAVILNISSGAYAVALNQKSILTDNRAERNGGLTATTVRLQEEFEKGSIQNTVRDVVDALKIFKGATTEQDAASVENNVVQMKNLNEAAEKLGTVFSTQSTLTAAQEASLNNKINLLASDGELSNLDLYRCMAHLGGMLNPVEPSKGTLKTVSGILKDGGVALSPEELVGFTQMVQHGLYKDQLDKLAAEPAPEVKEEAKLGR